MGSGKHLTIGITVNLEHYENLRLEVSGEVEKSDDALELVRFLDETLGRLGQGDPATKERVESYRRRVLASGLPAGDVDHPAPARQEPVHEVAAPVTPPGGADTPTTAVSIREPGEPVTPGIPISREKDPEQAAAPAVAGSGGGICESCGVMITAAEQKMSQLFTGKDLCKSCMKKT
ncbi:MAG TPA: hypothetical protein PLM96_08355 [Methanoregulaceae archaeon]|nr:hypothetical protein [Methanolinea sp.]MDD3092103.1 hypothetical protein [Methanoregulaceae archaeon]MDD5048116.1 hypothetical protein [Methanoregulaceae archaeon]MDD5685761.1 hypothetical protein [Methanoregulaceae archaeon]HPJ75152.1 hypothetical protein [Methanoregulaceae archaeon]